MLDLFVKYGVGFVLTELGDFDHGCSQYVSVRRRSGRADRGSAAANIVAVPPDSAVSPQPTARDVDLAAEPIEITIIDIGPTPGPLSIWRQLYVLAGLDPLTAGLRQHAGNTYDLPGLDTTVDSNTKWLVQAVRESDSIDFGAASEQGQLGSWELLGGIVASSAEVTGARNLHFKPLLGGTEGIGAALYGTLGNSTFERNLTFLGSQLDSTGDRTVGDFNGELALLPWDGFKVIGGDRRTPRGTSARRNSDRHGPYHHVQSGLAHWRSREQRNARRWRRSLSGVRQGELWREHRVPRGWRAGDRRLDGRRQKHHFRRLFDQQSCLDAGEWSVLRHGRGRRHLRGRVNLDIGDAIPIDIQIPRASSMTSLSSDRQA